MGTTAKNFYKFMSGNSISEKEKADIKADYFGGNDNHDKYGIIIRGVYFDMMMDKGISSDYLDRCFKQNKLDGLIHEQHKHVKSKNYTYFCENNIVIGTTCNKPDECDDFVLYDDDCCPTCKVKGYHTNKNNVKYHGSVVGCSGCFRFVCIKCSIKNGEDMWSNICTDCLNDTDKNDKNGDDGSIFI
jgi:hypothetical protein